MTLPTVMTVGVGPWVCTLPCGSAYLNPISSISPRPAPMFLPLGLKLAALPMCDAYVRSLCVGPGRCLCVWPSSCLCALPVRWACTLPALCPCPSYVVRAACLRCVSVFPTLCALLACAVRTALALLRC